MVITYSRVWISRVRLPTLFVVSWTGKMKISLSPFAPENLVSRDGFGRPVPRQSAQIRPSDQSRVYRVTQLRTAGALCRESTGTGPVVLKVIPVTGAAFAGYQGIGGNTVDDQYDTAEVSTAGIGTYTAALRVCFTLPVLYSITITREG